MPLFLDTRGRGTLGIGICARCNRKFSLEDLHPDGNSPGLRVCTEDWDTLDPWRLPPPSPDDITLDFPRPDTPLWPFDAVDIWTNQIDGVTRTYPAVVWQPTRFFRGGASVTPENVNDVQVTLPQYEFIALNGGISGATTPDWPTAAGVHVTDGAIEWLCVGIFLLDGNEPGFPASEFGRVIPPPTPVPPVIITDLSNNGGQLVLDPGVVGWPTSDAAVALGGLWSNGGVVTVKAGGTPASLSDPAYFFGSITAAQLLALGGNALPDVAPPAGSLRLWQVSFGEVLVA